MGASMQISERYNLLEVRDFVGQIFGETLHKKRQLSLANAALGILSSGSLLLHKMGAGLAEARGLLKKHATKQIDRLLSNPKLDIWELSADWVSYVVGERKEIIVSLDWTCFDNDKQWTLSLNLLTNHGRATPLLWKSVEKSRLKNNRARYEDQLLSRFREILANDIEVTLLADRGLADQKFFEFLEKTLGFHYIIRIKSNTFVQNVENESKPARDWLRQDGRASRILGAKITKKQYGIAQFISVKRPAMKEGWYLVSSRDWPASRVVKLYGRRWSIEPYFRDLKDIRFGFGMSFTHMKSPERRDRLLLMMALCYVLLTLLGAAGEQLGFDRHLKVNTVKTRTHSLIRQGQYYFEYFRNFSPQEKEDLINQFEFLLQQQPIWQKLLFVC
jgi:hypothetical protein